MANPSSDSTPVSGTNPSRRQFFHKAGLTAGGLYALAGPSLAGPWVSGAEAAEKPRSYVAGRFGLELDGVFCGLINAFEGGNYAADVITSVQGTDRFPKKILGPVKVEPLTVETGFEMGKPWYDWINKTMNLEFVRKNVTIVEMDQGFKEMSRRSFSNAIISEVEFPALNGSAKTPVALTVSITAEQLKLEAGTGKQVPASMAKGGQKAAMASNFRLNIQGLEQVTQRASRVDAFSFTQKIAAHTAGQSRMAQLSPTQPEFTNLAFSVGEANAGPLYAWFDDFVLKGGSNAKERPGILEYLGPDMKAPLATVQFSGLGIFKLATEGPSAGGDQIRRAKAEMYCQRFTATFNP